MAGIDKPSEYELLLEIRRYLILLIGMAAFLLTVAVLRLPPLSMVL